MTKATDRCAKYDGSIGRCQLIDAHCGRHAVSVDGAYLTWHRMGSQSWPKRNPPAWLTDLAWAPGYGPTAVMVSRLVDSLG